MLRFLSLFLLLALTLQALSNNDILKRADKFVSTSSKSNHFRAYNDYKNLYLRSIMSEDIKLRVKALRGIVKSGNKLRIDVNEYAEELAALNPSKSKKTVKKQRLKTYEPKQKKSKSIKIEPRHKLKRANFQNGKLILEFDKNLSSEQIKHFTLNDSKKNLKRYVFDIKTAMLTKSRTLKKKGIQRIKLAQFNSNTIRLVISNPKKLKLKYSRSGKKLLVDLGLSTESVKKTKVVSKTTTPSRLDRDKVIVIDAGHGGKDPGAVGYRKYREKIVVMQISKHVRSILKSRGYKVHMTRERDKFVKLSKRTKYANKRNADIFISIHANAVDKKNAKKVHGIETYFLAKSRSDRAKRVAAKENSADLSDMNFYGKQSFLNMINSHNKIASNKLAIDIQRGMLGSLKKKYKHVKDGGVREGPFWVLVGAQMPSVLVEVGFITHPREAKRLVSTAYQKQMARGIANGIERYFANCKV
jgi:N-acetylmuramoyl-L-alanine amidase